MAMIQQIDVDIKDEAEAHKHYKELADKYRAMFQEFSQSSSAAALWYECYTNYDAMSLQEGEHLQRLVRIRVMLLRQYA